ncbi:hypothetical protein AGMMS49525_11030 [Bacteroidia bacterium]|nr:hypothetical protein AGMMS49525_11030 [Bacteroidia bacterium]
MNNETIMRKVAVCFSLLSLILLSSCADDLYQSNPLNSSGREISFKTLSEKQFRASVTTTGSLTTFSTSAWSHPAGATNAYDGYVLNGVTVTRGEADGAGVNNWEYFPRANWPTIGEVDFFAYSPASSVNVTAGLKQNTSIGPPPAAGPEIQYTVPGWEGDPNHTVDRQEDFFVAKSQNLAYNSSNPIVHLNFKHALSRVVFKAQNQNKNKTYLIKELALSNLKSKGTLNILDSVPNGATGFPHSPGAYNVAWKAQSDAVTYKVDLGSTYVYVPYRTGTASSDYTEVTNASNGLMVMPQETVLGAFTDPSKEYGPVAEVDPLLTNASYLYATVAEVDSIANDTVNTRRIAFRLHDPADKTKGIVFEAGREYSLLLTLGLDSLDVAATFKCGDPIKGYTTANYTNTGIENLCWTTKNIAEVTTNSIDTYSGETAGLRGYYYPWDEADDACAALGAEWSVPNTAQWTNLQSYFNVLADGTGGGWTSSSLIAYWNSGNAMAGVRLAGGTWDQWDSDGAWWSSGVSEAYDVASGANSVTGPGTRATGDLLSVRCVRSI